MRVEHGPYAGLTSGQVADRYRQTMALIRARQEELPLVGFVEKMPGLLERIASMERSAKVLKSSIPETEFQKANRPHRRLLRYLGELAGHATKKA